MFVDDKQTEDTGTAVSERGDDLDVVLVSDFEDRRQPSHPIRQAGTDARCDYIVVSLRRNYSRWERAFYTYLLPSIGAQDERITLGR